MKKICIFVLSVFTVFSVTLSSVFAYPMYIENPKLVKRGKTAVIFGTLVGGEKDKVVKSLSVPNVMRTEIHTMSIKNGIMRMKKVDSLKIKAEQKIKFKKGRLHIMLMGIKGKLATAPVTITFTDNSTFTFVAR